MKQPPLETLRDKVDSRYTLVVVAAKRARQILENADQDASLDGRKPVTIALQELADGKLLYEHTRTAIK